MLTGVCERLLGALRGRAVGAARMVRLEGFADVEVLRPGLSWYVRRIRERRPFAVVKRTHGYWDQLVDLAEVVAEIGERVEVESSRFGTGRHRGISAETVAACLRPEVVAELEDRISKYKPFWSGGLAVDLIRDLQRPHPSEDYVEAISFRGDPGRDKRPARHPLKRLADVYRAFHTSGRLFHDAMAFKEGVLTGEFAQLIDAIRDRDVVLVGPPHFETLGSLLGFRGYRHIAIHPCGAAAEREAILDQCVAELRKPAERPKVVLVQAGTLAFWLIHRLFPLAQDACLLDLGRVLDIWYPDIGGVQSWFRRDRERIIANMGLERLYR